MISIPQYIIHRARKQHSKSVKDILRLKLSVIELCLNHFHYSQKRTQTTFDTALNSLSGDSVIKVASINWFLLKNSRKSLNNPTSIQRKIARVTKTDNFFKPVNRIFTNDPVIMQALKERIAYFDDTVIDKILSGKPDELILADQDYKNFFSKKLSKAAETQVERLISFLFDYEEFSEKNSFYAKAVAWSAYEFTNELGVRTCLYCNRTPIVTVSFDGKKIIRAELDHFFAKSIYPILALSFYNLIPSCHNCNSNLKGKVEFSLTTHLHPYISNFDDEGVRFTYQPTNPKAFFSSDKGLKIKLDLTRVKNYALQIRGNVEQFKLNEIYQFHMDVVESFINLQRKTNRKRLDEIFRKIIPSTGRVKFFHSEKEIYELIIRNYYSHTDFHKRPMAKFEKDIAMEIGLIDKK